MNKRKITELARTLRKNQTPSEKSLWTILQKRRLGGHKILRQKPIIYEDDRKKLSFFIADFYCSKTKTVIEVDGKIHDYQKYYDQERDKVINAMGLRVLRIKNDELQSIDQVKKNSFLYRI